MNGRQLNQGLLGSLHISPVQPTFEPQSVPYYLQQDLEALQRVSQQHTSASSLSQQTSPRSQTSLLTTPSSPRNGGLRAKRLERNGRRLSLDPYTRLRVEKLEVVGLTIYWVVFILDPEMCQWLAMFEKIPVIIIIISGMPHLLGMFVPTLHQGSQP